MATTGELGDDMVKFARVFCNFTQAIETLVSFTNQQRRQILSIFIEVDVFDIDCLGLLRNYPYA